MSLEKQKKGTTPAFPARNSHARPANRLKFGGNPFRCAGFRLAWPLMEAPRRYSVSPLHSFVTVPTTQHVPSFTESARLIWRWLRGVEPNWRERAREARIVDAVADLMAAEIEEEDAVQGTVALDAKGTARGEGHGATTT